MAEQDRLGSHMSTQPTNPVKDSPSINLKNLKGVGAEQDHFNSWFGGKRIPWEKATEERLGSGADQDRYGKYFSNKAPSLDQVKERLGRVTEDIAGPGSEQDRYASHFNINRPDNPVVAPGGSSNWSLGSNKGVGGAAEQDRLGSHFSLSPSNPVNTTSVGLLQSAILPSFGLHSGLSIIAYGIGRYTDRAEAKDYLWPSGLVANAWWSAIGSRVFYNDLSPSTAWSVLPYPGKLLLGGVTAWGVRLFYRIATRSIARGKDDPRYEAAKKDPGFWNKAIGTLYLPEALMQTLIALPFTLPFRAEAASAAAAPTPLYAGWVQALAVFLFSSGYALEVLADAQLASHREEKSDLNRDGVWSIVRHPNYLGDTLIHASFPLLLYSAGILHPLALLGPVANYAFLRYIGGAAELEQHQVDKYQKEDPGKFEQLKEYKQQKNSFWPKVEEFGNSWTWIVLGVGAASVAVERGLRQLL